MKKLSSLCLAAVLVVLASCGEGGKDSARDFAAAVGLKDTMKINSVLGGRKAAWNDGVSFAAINADSLTIVEIGEKQYRATADNSTYFVFTELEKGYRVDTVKNVFRSNPQLVEAALSDSLLTQPYDDIDAMNAVVKETAKQADAAKAQKALDDEVIKELKDFYNYGVLNTYSDVTPTIEKKCTKKMKRKLAAAYGYEDGGYAVWELRCGAQDGDGGSQVNDVIPQGNGWYMVDFLDMGMRGKKEIKAVKQNGKILFDDYR